MQSVLDEEEPDEDKGQCGHFAFAFLALEFLNSFIPCPSNGQPKPGQTKSSFQNNEGKNTKLKKQGQIHNWNTGQGQEHNFPIL
jgi:hypothetical protein